LSKRATDAGHIIDVFVGCYDQVGLLEMKTCFSKTGGFVVLSDSFNTSIFKQSFQRLFAKKDGNLIMAFNANLDIQTSKDLKICGAIGPCVSNNKKTSHVGETVSFFFSYFDVEASLFITFFTLLGDWDRWN